MSKIIAFAVVVSFLIAGLVRGQEIEWEQTFGGSGDDVASCVQRTSDGGYILSGSSGRSIYLVKTDANGDTLWTQAISDIDRSTGTCIRQTTDNGYIIAVSAGSDTDSDAYLIKTDGAGSVDWIQEYIRSGNDRLNWVELTNDGGYVGVGRTGGPLRRVTISGS
jgi:hypothetical protein